MLIGIYSVDEVILEPEEEGPGIFKHPIFLSLQSSVDPNFLKSPLEGQTVIAPKGHNPHAILKPCILVPDRDEGGLNSLVEGVDEHISANGQFIFINECPMCKLVDDGDDDSTLYSINFKEEDVAVVILVDDIEIVVAIGGTSKHGVSLGLGQIGKDLVYFLDFIFFLELQ